MLSFYDDGDDVDSDGDDNDGADDDMLMMPLYECVVDA